MQLDDIRNSNAIIFECVSGSRAYGLDLPTSDTDLKGVYILPEERFFALDYVEQVSSAKNDVVFYELKRFIELLYKNNPNLLEMLATPEEHIRTKHALFDLITPDLFLSKLCFDTFANYAQTQIKAARGLNKKIVNPVDKERKGILDFCYVLEEEGSKSVSKPLQEWLDKQGFVQECCGLVILPHFRDLYALYYDETQSFNFQGIDRSHSTEVALSSVPKGMPQKALLSFNKDAYQQYCRAYKEYWEWVEARNPERYQNTIDHGKNYDAKNMMHTFRLLDMAEEIALQKRLVVKRPNREELLRIRRGEYPYEELLQKAKQKLDQIKNAFHNSDLPERPDKQKIDDLLVSIRRKFYQK